MAALPCGERWKDLADGVDGVRPGRHEIDCQENAEAGEQDEEFFPVVAGFRGQDAKGGFAVLTDIRHAEPP